MTEYVVRRHKTHKDYGSVSRANPPSPVYPCIHVTCSLNLDLPEVSYLLSSATDIFVAGNLPTFYTVVHCSMVLNQRISQDSCMAVDLEPTNICEKIERNCWSNTMPSWPPYCAVMCGEFDPQIVWSSLTTDDNSQG